MGGRNVLPLVFFVKNAIKVVKFIELMRILQIGEWYFLKNSCEYGRVLL